MAVHLDGLLTRFVPTIVTGKYINLRPRFFKLGNQQLGLLGRDSVIFHELGRYYNHMHLDGEILPGGDESPENVWLYDQIMKSIINSGVTGKYP